MTIFPPELKRFLQLDGDATYAEHSSTADATRFEVHNRTYKAGTVIVHEGKPSSLLRFLKSGWVLGETWLSDGTRQVIDIYMKNELMELPTIDGMSRVTLHAIADTSVLEFSWASTLDLITKQPELAYYFSSATSRVRAIHVEHIISLGRRTAVARTAHFVLELAERCTPEWEGQALDFDCPLTQADLADVLGITPIHMNRILAKLRMQDLMVMHKGKISILDRAALVATGSFSPNYLSPRR